MIFVCKSIYKKITAALRDVFLKLTSELQLPVSKQHLMQIRASTQVAHHAVFSTLKHWKHLDEKCFHTFTFHFLTNKTMRLGEKHFLWVDGKGLHDMMWYRKAGLQVGWSFFLETLKNNPLHCRPLPVTEQHLLQVAGWSIKESAEQLLLVVGS